MEDPPVTPARRDPTVESFDGQMMDLVAALADETPDPATMSPAQRRQTAAAIRAVIAMFERALAIVEPGETP
jgi:hypothetical protein